MHTVELLSSAIRYAEELGIHVREDWLDGATGGGCEVHGQRWLVLDLSQTPQERLSVIAGYLAEYSLEADAEVPQELGHVVRKRPAA